MYISLLLLYDMRQKKRRNGKIVYINVGNNDVENKTGILYNDTVNQ